MRSFDSKIGSKYEKGVKIGFLTSCGANDTFGDLLGKPRHFMGTGETFWAKEGGFQST